MISDQDLDNMLSRSIEAEKLVQISQVDILEKKYNSLIHALMGIHQFYVKDTGDMQSEIAILQSCFDQVAEKFVRE